MKRRAREPIAIEDDDRARFKEELRAYLLDEHDDEVGDLKADLLIDFIVGMLGPAIYNRAIQDAQTHLQERLLDMEAVLHRDPE